MTCTKTNIGWILIHKTIGCLRVNLLVWDLTCCFCPCLVSDAFYTIQKILAWLSHTCTMILHYIMSGTYFAQQNTEQTSNEQCHITNKESLAWGIISICSFMGLWKHLRQNTNSKTAAKTPQIAPQTTLAFIPHVCWPKHWYHFIIWGQCGVNHFTKCLSKSE